MEEETQDVVSAVPYAEFFNVELTFFGMTLPA